jgi:hypothetical protein
MVMPSTEAIPVHPAMSLPPATTPPPFPFSLCQDLVSVGSVAGLPFGQLVSNAVSILQQKKLVSVGSLAGSPFGQPVSKTMYMLQQEERPLVT